MKPCFQINSKKLEKELLFRDGEDYIYGINTLALILLRNPFKAKTCYPGDYPWSSVGMYFSRRGQWVGRKASTFTARELRRMLEDWL